MFDRSQKSQKVRVPEYTFSLLPPQSRPIWLLYHFDRFRFSSLNKRFSPTGGYCLGVYYHLFFIYKVLWKITRIEDCNIVLFYSIT
jgi:hypothetical protein